MVSGRIHVRRSGELRTLKRDNSRLGQAKKGKRQRRLGLWWPQSDRDRDIDGDGASERREGWLQSVPDGPAPCSVVTTLQSLACKAILPLRTSVSVRVTNFSLSLSLSLSFSFIPVSPCDSPSLSSFCPFVWPSSLFSPLSHSRGTYQRQGNLICLAVRRTLTELNVWFPFIRVHLRTAALHIPPRHPAPRASFALSFRSIIPIEAQARRSGPRNSLRYSPTLHSLFHSLAGVAEGGPVT